MSELLRVLTDDAVDDDTLAEAAAAAHAVLQQRGVNLEGVAPVCHEAASAAGQRAIDQAVAGEPELELKLTPVHGDTRRLQVGANPDPGAPFLLIEHRYTGCVWRHNGTENLRGVEIDGRVWHEADARDGAAEGEAGP